MQRAVIKQVFRVLDEIVHTDSDSVIEQRQVQTDVCLVGLFHFKSGLARVVIAMPSWPL